MMQNVYCIFWLIEWQKINNFLKALCYASKVVNYFVEFGSLFCGFSSCRIVKNCSVYKFRRVKKETFNRKVWKYTFQLPCCSSLQNTICGFFIAISSCEAIKAIKQDQQFCLYGATQIHMVMRIMHADNMSIVAE